VNREELPTVELPLEDNLPHLLVHRPTLMYVPAVAQLDSTPTFLKTVGCSPATLN